MGNKILILIEHWSLSRMPPGILEKKVEYYKASTAHCKEMNYALPESMHVFAANVLQTDATSTIQRAWELKISSPAHDFWPSFFVKAAVYCSEFHMTQMFIPSNTISREAVLTLLSFGKWCIYRATHFILCAQIS